MICFFLIYERYNFLGLRDTSRKPEIIEMGVFGFFHKQIEKLWDQIEAE